VWFFTVFFLLYFIFAKNILPAIARALKLRLRVLNYFSVTSQSLSSVDSLYKGELVAYAKATTSLLLNLNKHMRLYTLALKLQQEKNNHSTSSTIKDLFGKELVLLLQRRILK